MESKNLFTSINHVLNKLNPLIIAILRSPLHSMMSKAIMLITFTGQKSGKRYTTPVSYAREGETVYVFTHGEMTTSGKRSACEIMCAQVDPRGRRA